MSFKSSIGALLGHTGLRWPAPMLPEERYYVTVFAFQSEPKHPATSHTFAVFSRVY